MPRDVYAHIVTIIQITYSSTYSYVSLRGVETMLSTRRDGLCAIAFGIMPNQLLLPWRATPRSRYSLPTPRGSQYVLQSKRHLPVQRPLLCYICQSSFSGCSSRHVYMVRAAKADSSRVAPTHRGVPDRAQIFALTQILWATPTVSLEA